MNAPVIVGLDDLDHARHALTLAASEAELRAAPLWIAHSCHRIPPVATATTIEPVAPAAPAGSGDGGAETAVRDPDVEPLAQAVRQTRAEYPGLEIHGYAVGAPAAAGLTGLAGKDSLLVVGHRGRGGFVGMLLGSVALSTIGHSRCPVVVARGTDRALNRVVVGLDVTDATGGEALLGFAFAEAALRGAELVVVTVWEDVGYFYPDPVGAYTRDNLTALDAEHDRALGAILDPWRGEHPETRVHALVQGGSVTRHLVDASEEADLLIIGGRPHRDGEGVRLGGSAYAVLHHAQCPVVVVPDR